jgi:hypothetical protein
MIREASKIKDGIRCIKKALSCCQMVIPGAKKSAANKLIKKNSQNTENSWQLMK